MTALLAALDGGSRLAVDTAPLIYLVERHPEFGPPVRTVVERAESGNLVLVSSVLTLTEVLTLPFDKGAHRRRRCPFPEVDLARKQLRRKDELRHF